MSPEAVGRRLLSCLQCPHSGSTQSALFRVFVQPHQTRQATSRTRSHTSLAYKTSRNRHTPIQLSGPRLSQHRRYATWTRHPEQDRTATDVRRNEGIGSLYVNFVDAEGGMHAKQPLRQILRTLNRDTHVLLAVQEGDPDASQDAMQHWPVVRIFSHEDLRKREKERDQQRADQKRIAASSKTIELSWTIAEHDLAHRLKKTKQFLEEGRKVEIMLARKKRSKPVTPAECRRLIDSIESELEQVKDAKQSKPAQGKLGGMISLFWEGKRKRKDQKAETQAQDV